MGDGRMLGKFGLDEKNHLRYPPHIENSHQLMLFGSDDENVGEELQGDIKDNNLSMFHQIVAHAVHRTPRDGPDWEKPQYRKFSPFYNEATLSPHTAHDPTDELNQIQALTAEYREFLDELDLQDLVNNGFAYAVTNANPANNVDWKAVLDIAKDANSIGLGTAITDARTAMVGSGYNPDIAEQNAGTVAEPTLVSVDPIETPEAPNVSAPSVTQDVDGAVSAFRKRQRRDLAQTLTSIAGGLFDIRGVMTSTFDHAMAMAHLAAEDQVSDYDQQLRQERVRLQNQNRLREMELQAQIDNQIATIIAQAYQRDRELEVESKTRHEALKSQVGQYNDQMKVQSHFQSRDSILRAHDRQMSHEERIEEITGYRQQAKLETANSIVRAMLQQFGTTLVAKGQIFASAHQAQHTTNQQVLTTRNDEIDHNIQLDKKDRMWNLDLWKYANQGMGAASGTPAAEADRTFDRQMEGLGAIAAGAALYQQLYSMLR